MVRKLKVDIEASLGYQANGRLRPADKSEYANKDVKMYECPRCNHKTELSMIRFGEDVLCPNCNEIMIRVY